MINRLNFYKNIRLSFGKLTQKQVEGFEAILNKWDLKGYNDIRWLAYMFATVWHETAKTMQPIEEYGKGISKSYGKKLKHSGMKYDLPNKIYYGRGFVQLTWYENYQLLGRLLGIDLLNNPELVLTLDVSTKILFEGMTKGSSSFGDFTGKCLELYFNDKIEDPINARKIINGIDKAKLISEYYYNFKTALL
jgi:putative chitinase